MITSKTMYDLYEANLKEGKVILESEIHNLSIPYNKLVSYFRNNVPNIPAVSSTLEEILNNKGEEIPFPVSVTEKYYNLQLKTFKSLYILYHNKKEQEKIIKNQKIPYKVFVFVIRRFNQLLVEELVYNSYKFTHLFIGTLSVFCNKNKNSINWGESTKNKQRLLIEGKVPYIKEDAELAVKNNIPYEGVPWIVKQAEYGLFYKWAISPAQSIRINNIHNFSMIPYRGVNSAVQVLNDYKNTLSTEDLANLYNTQNYVS